MTLCPLSSDWGSVSDVLSAVAAVTLAGTAGYSAFIAARTYQSAERLKQDELLIQRNAKAKEVWANYLQIAFENADLTRKSFSDIPRHEGDMITEESEKYEWFVATMFFSAEEIIAVVGNQPEWRETIKNQIRYYRDYIIGPVGKIYNSTYDPLIRELVLEVESESQDPQVQAKLGGSRA